MPAAGGARGFAGYPVGILVLPVTYPLIVGNVANAQSHSVPVLFQEVEGVSPEQIMRGDPDAGKPIVDAALRLQASGVRAIVGACGSFANYQLQVAAAVDIPVYMSILVQVPFLLAGLGHHRKLAVLMASRASLTRNVLQQCGVDDAERLVVGEVCDLPEFRTLMAGKSFDEARMRDEITRRGRDLARSDPNISGLILQCSDLPPYRAAISAASGLPVYSALELIAWLASAVDHSLAFERSATRGNVQCA